MKQQFEDMKKDLHSIKLSNAGIKSILFAMLLVNLFPGSSDARVIAFVIGLLGFM